ncbi:hypothetical protein HDEF_0019 [Candidatus Hamiltonella defensa 5AT (Acyrthosiphon pisum)]|uniref:Uncharacterized protein n=1 Tax=Hamiltonella defensa subsp. Acyrthosiphon pisum (strain 5AT) TaxID=572265 RepID=C4K835_HAMD5|nr:hypothetical protein HDEF_0019 [Candidatus Hamiltonella defensa 5AT (Acyrthosiphon pisum)]
MFLYQIKKSRCIEWHFLTINWVKTDVKAAY